MAMRSPLAESVLRIETWMAAKKLELDGAPWEFYLTDPGIEPDASKWRTNAMPAAKPYAAAAQPRARPERRPWGYARQKCRNSAGVSSVAQASTQ